MKTVAPNNRAGRWKPSRYFLRSSIPQDLSRLAAGHGFTDLTAAASLPGKIPGAGTVTGVGTPRIDEARVLEIKPGHVAIIRQVQLLCDGQPWVYARTVIPVTSLRGKLQRLAHLGTRPLGGMLFADPGMQRGGVELARISRGQSLYRAATCHQRQRPAAIWGRRSVFRLCGRPLLVSEVFLPGFPAGSPPAPCWRSSGMKL